MRPCCAPSRGLVSAPAETKLPDAGGQPRGLVELPRGRFRMGCDRGEGHPLDREGPARDVDVDPFAIGKCAVTNAEFAEFVEETGFVTDAERFGWSFVFDAFVAEGARAGMRGQAAGAPWWLGVDGASWAHPFGIGSTVDELPDHPVVHVSRNDALAYCDWTATRLPAEAEWEYAARGGLEQMRYPWGDERNPDGDWYCNIWQGSFPHHNAMEDGYACTAPAQTYPPNGFGLYQTVGNVWEWTMDMSVHSHDAFVIRGGSYLCHDSYCNRYRVAARSANTGDSSGGNLGFRVAADR